MADQKLPPWAVDLIKAVPDDQVRAIVEDLRGYNPSPSMGKAAEVKLQGVGRAYDGDDMKRTTSSHGWVTPPQVDQWKPPGLEAMDRLVDQQDMLDKAARAKELIEAAAQLKALEELTKPKEPGK
jgi:hypothetical protein